jgi:hypothetical protein
VALNGGFEAIAKLLIDKNMNVNITDEVNLSFLNCLLSLSLFLLL